MRQIVLLALLMLILSNSASATCFGRHGITGQMVQAVEVGGQTIGNAYATSNWMPNGWPIITYGPRFFLLDPLLQSFVKIHECAHLSIPTSDEIRANCTALKSMRHHGLSDDEEDEIANWTRSEGLIDLRYGGTGEAFWNATLACAGTH